MKNPTSELNNKKSSLDKNLTSSGLEKDLEAELEGCVRDMFDCCFTHSRMAKAKFTGEPLMKNVYFLDQQSVKAEIEKFEKCVSSKDIIHCNNFIATSDVGKKKNVKDDTGIGGIMCVHGCGKEFTTMFTGER